jgi:membrane protease YdiL (CAAX protease family)
VAQSNSTRKQIFIDRFVFLFEIIIVFVGIYLLLLIPNFLRQILDKTSPMYGPIFYSLRALMLFLAIPIFIALSSIILESQRKELIVEEDISPVMGHLKLYGVSKSNYKYQLLYGLLLLFIVFIPLDFFTYLFIPDMLEYNAVSIGSRATDSHFLATFGIFIVSAIIIQISVSIYEETLSRGFLTKRGSENFNKISAVIIASFYFGLMHGAYILDPSSANFPIYFPLIWFSQALFIGLILSMFVQKKKWLFPAIFAHALNNIISSLAVWFYIQRIDFQFIAVVLYLPLLIISLLLIVWQFSTIKESLSTGLKELGQYFKLDGQSNEVKGDNYIRLFADISIGFIIFAIGLFVFSI